MCVNFYPNLFITFMLLIRMISCPHDGTRTPFPFPFICWCAALLLPFIRQFIQWRRTERPPHFVGCYSSPHSHFGCTACGFPSPNNSKQQVENVYGVYIGRRIESRITSPRGGSRNDRFVFSQPLPTDPLSPLLRPIPLFLLLFANPHICFQSSSRLAVRQCDE